MNITLKIDDLEVPLGFHMVASIVDGLYDIPENQAIFDALIDHPASHVRQRLATKDHLSERAVLSLANDTDVDVLRNLVDSSAFREFATTEIMVRLIGLNDGDMARSIAVRIEEYSSCDRKILIEALVANPDPSIRFALAQNSSMPKSVHKRLLEDSDPDVRIHAVQNRPR